MTSTTFHDGRLVLHAGDCLDVLATLPESSVDAIVTDPPYHLTSIVKLFGGTSQEDNTATSARARAGADGMARMSRGFMGKTWDGGDIAFRPETWRVVLRVLKPGGHLVAFAAPKNSHRMVCAIEDAGVEIRDALMWLYSVGFPKNHNVSRNNAFCRCSSGDDKMRGVREDQDNASRVVPQSEDADVLSTMQWGLARSGVGEARTQRVDGEDTGEFCKSGDEGIEKPGMEGRRDLSQEARELCQRSLHQMPEYICDDGAGGRLCDGTSPRNGDVDRTLAEPDGVHSSQGSQPASQLSGEFGTVALQQKSQDGGVWPH